MVIDEKLESVIREVVDRNPGETEFHQSVREVLESLGPVVTKHPEFLEHKGRYFRRTEIWRTVIDKRTGDRLGDELVKRNCALVMYLPAGVPVTHV